MAAITRAVGASGRRYVVERLLQDRSIPLGQVYLASADNQQYVLKEVRKNKFQNFQDMFNDLRICPYLRVADDAIPDQSMFAYKFLKEDYLSFGDREIPLPLTKRILKDCLRGIAAMHDRGIVHTDIKPSNIVLDWDEKDGNITINKVQIADLEDAKWLPEGHSIIGRQVGNWMWRSPEAHASYFVNSPTDMFSFGLVCIYAVMKSVICAVNEENVKEIEDRVYLVVEKHISYFATRENIVDFIDYLGDDNPWFHILEEVLQGFHEGKHAWKPLKYWGFFDAELRDILAKMTNLDPRSRIKAREALSHPWFAEVD